MVKNLREISVQFIKGVGPQRKKTFERLGVFNAEDLLYLFPRRYEDRTSMTPLSELKVGEWQTVSGKVLKQSGRKSWHTKKHVYEMQVGDDHSRVFCVWFNRPYLDRYFEVGQQVVLYGKVDIYKDRLQLVSPDYEIITDDEEDRSLSVGRIVPIYPLTRGITQRYIRKTIKRCLDKYAVFAQDVLPDNLRKKYKLDNLVKSLWNIHFPEDEKKKVIAYKRVSFEEFFLFQISVLLRRLNIVQKKGIVHRITEDFYQEFLNLFSFDLTAAQKKTIQEIISDLTAISPMHRLLQGDVGSGKTLVAFFACLAAVKNGHQAALMAPTEILARQHYEVLKKIIENSPFCNTRIEILINETDKREKEEIISQVKKGKVDVLIGTHALIQQGVEFKDLSVAIIDEQHKFGVRQRALLSAKGKSPDVLVMTATPIPRTLCLTLYGDLDVSTIDEMPVGRGKIETMLFSHNDAFSAYKIIKESIESGQQAYIVYPIIDESEKLDLKSAEQMFRQFKREEFKDFRLGLLHGQMKKHQAQDVMHKFKQGEIQILVATTVLEVGVDVPNATVMLIEHADRFGLSQLHQLRGRIGRGRLNSKCLLISEPTTQEGQARLDAILSTNDGFEIAQKDFLIRGPGEFFGRHQHGLNELKDANPQAQMDILELARVEAIDLTKQDPELKKSTNTGIKDTILRRYPNYLANILSG
ncbi:MAG: ATP-dependent DNA helicase RecG [Candidatus Omnitrophica bacterium]|nr:ATP-dependent DNA helicase RecG [Candidatus Omnitrophota bacterium]